MLHLFEEKNISKENVSFLNSLQEQLIQANSIREKIEILNETPPLRDYEKKSRSIRKLLKNLSLEEELSVKSIIAIKQDSTVFALPSEWNNCPRLFQNLLQELIEIESFYNSIGGIIGYHASVIGLLQEKRQKKEERKKTSIQYHQPKIRDISQNTEQVRKAILGGIEFLPLLSEIYPLGGAGDRLNLIDENIGVPLPAANLLFCGRSLLEGLIRDLQAREYLLYKIFGKQVETPIAIMTSQEKNNHQCILSLLKKHSWFGRSKNRFRLFMQSSVPVITEEGNWSMKAPLQLNVKPGGHGSIWKLAIDNGIFDWLRALDRSKILIRQINNPIAGSDNTLLTFTGIGCLEDKDFGFASCQRTVNSSEGMNVLKERRVGKVFERSLSNIEYTEFSKAGIEDLPIEPNSPYSCFPSNTNILFADLDKIESAASKHPIPGMIINMKNTVLYKPPEGEEYRIRAGRLESTMQNIADYLVEKSPDSLKEKEGAMKKTFLTYNKRRKTISVTKKSRSPNHPIHETPEDCYDDTLRNAYELLSECCNMKLPDLWTKEQYTKRGPNFIFFMHPALGPLYSIISQKIQGGSISKGSELQMEIAELDLKNVDIEGSLLIHAHDCMGRKEKSHLKYSENTGKCTLRQVKIINRGINADANNIYWKNAISRHESTTIILHGNAEFYASNLTLKGNHRFEAQDGQRLIVSEENGRIVKRLNPIKEPSWYWKYNILEDKNIQLEKQLKEDV